MDRVGFEGFSIFNISIYTDDKEQRLGSRLRSWVQIPPGPLLSVVQVRYWFELILNTWRTNSAAIGISISY